ncbi:hypothetical protein P4O66_011943, partial [Electrophorus voltai]
LRDRLQAVQEIVKKNPCSSQTTMKIKYDKKAVERQFEVHCQDFNPV